MKHIRFSLSLLACAGFTVSGFAQNSTLTEREGYRAGIVGPDPEGSAVISDQPRYYLDTIDSLNRFADDESREAPGLSKNNYIGRVFPVYNTNAIEIQSYLLRTVAFEGGTVEVMGLSGVKDAQGREAQYLYVTAPDFMFPGIEEIVEVSDRPGFKFYDQTGADFGGGAGAISYQGKHRTASELVSILSGTELGNVGAFLFPPFADDSTNTIYIVENPTDIADDLLALELFDRPPLQVELDVKIYEVADDDGGTLGLDWDAFRRGLNGTLTYTGGDDGFFFDGGSDAYSTLLTMDAQVVADFLAFTVKSGTSELMTSTKLTMVNSEDIAGGLTGGARGTSTGVPAKIEVTTPIPFEISADRFSTPEEFNPLGIDQVEEGVTVEFLAFIGTESITIDVDMDTDSLVGYSQNQTPLIANRNLSTVVNLSDGETIVLGGLDYETSTEVRNGVPLLKDIPVLGYLFGATTKRETTSKIIMVLKPTIKSSDDVSEFDLY